MSAARKSNTKERDSNHPAWEMERCRASKGAMSRTPTTPPYR